MAHESGADNSITRAIDGFRRIFRAVRLSARRAEHELGLSGAQLFVLQQLGERSARSLNELAERTHTHQSSVSVVVSRLVDRGLVERTRAREDTRRVELRLSDAGRALLRRSRPAVQVQLIQAIADLPASRRRDLAGILERLVGEMGLARSPASMLFTESDGPSPADHAAPAAGRRGRRSGAMSLHSPF